jgi:hypothetical protein
MASIGSVTFFSLKYGEPAPPGEMVENVTRPGSDGVALRQTGKRGQGFQLVGIQHHANAGAAQTHIDNCQDLQGTLQTVTLDSGNTRTEIAITNTRPREEKGIVAPSIEYRTVVEFECIDTSTT